MVFGMSKVRVTLTIGEDVLERVDEAAWRSRLSRSAFVEDVLEHSGRLVAEEAVVSVMPKAADAGDSARVQAASSAISPAGECRPDWRGGKP